MRTAQPHSQRAHAQLAPSAAYRWINCPGSIKASAGIEETSSAFADEGTAAHELCNLTLEQNLDPSDYLGNFVDIDDKQHLIKKDVTPNRRNIWEVTDEMVDSVRVYNDHVHSLIGAAKGLAILDVEQKLDMRHIHPSIWGTGDAVVYDVDDEHLHVCDFKYGKGVVVSPEENPQLFLYGAGAARRYHNQRLSKITLHVVQPRAQGADIKSWETDLLDLFDFEGTIALAAARTDEPDAPMAAGSWCQFCPLKATCKVRREKVMVDAQAEFDDVTGELTLPAVADLTPAQRGHILRAADQIHAYAKAVQEAEHANALAGNPPEGFKLVAKRATRKFAVSPEVVIETFKGSFESPEDLYSEPKLLSAPQFETKLGKKAFAAILADYENDTGAKLVVKKSSGVNLVPLEDPAPAVGADAMAEFSVV